MKILRIIPAYTFLLLSVFGYLRIAAQSIRMHTHFDTDWKFHLGHATDPRRDFNYGLANIFSKSGDAGNTAARIDFKDDDWNSVQLPHDWAVELPFRYVKNEDLDAHGYKAIGGLFPENSVGWYRKAFTIAAADSGARFEIQFDGVYRDSKVWLNGYYLGGNFSGYMGKSFDITDFIKFGQKNVLVVRADASQDEGWFYEGAGIYRHVWLNKYDNLHFESNGGLFAYAAINGEKATLTVQNTIQNKSLKDAEVTVQAFVIDRMGNIVAASGMQPFNLQTNASTQLQQQLTVAHPHLWDLDDPYLYRIAAVIRENGRVVDSVATRFGFRTIYMDKDKGLFLNGKPVKVKGTSNHQDHAGVGSALPDYLQYYRIALLKQMGCNAYRATHNPPTPELLDACDSLGMLVMDETRLLNSGDEYAQQLKKLILRDRNHPSVFIWSIGNEEHATQHTNIGKRIAQNQLLLQRYLDPSRTSTYAANQGNYFQGVNEVIPVRGFNYHIDAFDAYHRDHPGQPVIGTEVASTVTTRGIFVKDTLRAYVPDYDSTYPAWASTAEQWWTLAAARSWFMGGFVWTGFDYRGEPTPYTWPNINSHFGVMDMCGFPKTVYYYYQSWWSNKDIIHIAPHWNWKGEEGQPKLLWINSNAEQVELFLNGKSLGKKAMPENGHLTWTVRYEPGKLEAIAYKGGRKFSAKVETTGAPDHIVLTPSKDHLIQDGEDAVVVNVSVADKQGREVPDAVNLIHFSVAGAEIIGVGNGDPSSHEPDKYAENAWQRRLFGGKAQVIIRAVNNNAEVPVLLADGPGLKGTQVKL